MSYSQQSSSAAAPFYGPRSFERVRARWHATRLPRPELVALLALAGVLNLWALSRNGWANDYYSAAVRSMSSSWHDFLFASLDRSGVMTVDKPPLALWVQALSVRAFGFNSLSLLVPQALMGVASVALVYDLVRRRFGRLGGFVAGLALALTPITVAISRHNNPDALLVLCSVAALWCVVRGLEDGRTRWLVLAGVCVGLGFETKMGVALAVVPGIAAAWLWIAPRARGRVRAFGQLLCGGAAMVLVGGAWPALVELVPAGDRPWVSGTSDNRVLSLIFEYNGLGRVDGQTGGPGGPGGGGGGTMFGGSTGPLRLLNEALGGQVGWLLGFALVAGLAIVLQTRLRRSHPATGWLLAVGGAFATTAVLFSFASGIFHPYYVSLLAPFAAALVGAGAAQLTAPGRRMWLLAPAAIAAGAAVELVVRSRYPGQLAWLAPVLIVACGLAIVALLAFRSRAVRTVALCTAIAALLLAPGAWAVDTLGHATNGTFPEGGPSSALTGFAGARGGGFGGPGGRSGRPGATGATGGAGAGAVPQLFGAGAGAGSGSTRATQPPAAGRGLAGPPGGPSAGGGEEASAGAGAGGLAASRAGAGGGMGRSTGAGAGGSGGAGGGFAGPGGGFGGGPGGAPMGGTVSKTLLAYVAAHGGGTIAVASQSAAATSIIANNAVVAGIGGFSGRESDVSVAWLASEVRAGKIRWVLDDETAGGAGAQLGGRLPGDTRSGSRVAIAAAARACRRVTTSTTAASGSSSGSGTLYDCQGRAGALARAGT